MNAKVVYFMRGLPSRGKSYEGRSLEDETAVVCEGPRHLLSASTIGRRTVECKPDLTVEEILRYEPPPVKKERG